VSGRCFFEEVIRENIDLGRPEQVQLIFSRKLKKSTVADGRCRTRIITEGVIPLRAWPEPYDRRMEALLPNRAIPQDLSRSTRSRRLEPDTLSKDQRSTSGDRPDSPAINHLTPLYLFDSFQSSTVTRTISSVASANGGENLAFFAHSGGGGDLIYGCARHHCTNPRRISSTHSSSEIELQSASCSGLI
jgi:hypothetical protein